MNIQKLCLLWYTHIYEAGTQAMQQGHMTYPKVTLDHKSGKRYIHAYQDHI